MKYTYTIEYNLKDTPNAVYHAYYSSDDVLEHTIVLGREDLRSVLITPHSLLASFIFEGKYLSVADLSQLFFNETDFSLEVRVLSKHQNKYEFNKYLSNDIYVILDRTVKGIKLLSNSNLSHEAISETAEVVEDKLSQIDLYVNYLLIAAEKPFLIYINRTDTIKYCRDVLQEIISLFDADLIKAYDSIDYTKLSDLKKRLYKVIQSVFYAVSSLLNNMTSIVGISYQYTAYISLRDYFSHLFQLLDLSVGMIADEKTKDKKKSKDVLAKEYTKQEILEKLCPSFKYRKDLEIILEQLEQNYHITDCSKLDKASLVCLLNDHFNFFNRSIANKFNQLRKLVLQYYGLSDVSYKINDCKDRRVELYGQYPSFWEKMKNRGSFC